MPALQRMWYQGHPLQWLLLPFTWLFSALTALRRRCYAWGLLRTHRVEAFVIVVGNISVGGNGKTPVVLALAEHLRQQGIAAGILSRGYGAKSDYYPRLVQATDPAGQVGDEPRLLARRSGLPVVIDPVRARGAKYLSEELKCDVIICDDGLQHYALHRDMELVVMDGRGLGNGHLLPMGPLRERDWRLAQVDAIIHNTGLTTAPALTVSGPRQYAMTLHPGEFKNVCDPDVTRQAEDFGPVAACAGIGAPDRFFSQLRAMGLTLDITRGFPDHHHYRAGDVPAGTVIVTEKDAVKLQHIAHADCWYLPVDAQLPTDFYALVGARLKQCKQKQKR